MPDLYQRLRNRFRLQMPTSRQVNRSGTPEASAETAHGADLQLQDRYDVKYPRYRVDAAAGKVFCLVEAPDAESAARVHREAHGLVADRVLAVHEGTQLARAGVRWLTSTGAGSVYAEEVALVGQPEAVCRHAEPARPAVGPGAHNYFTKRHRVRPPRHRLRARDHRPLPRRRGLRRARRPGARDPTNLFQLNQNIRPSGGR